MMQKTQHSTKIIAHRGDTSQFPENTLEAFEAALRGGADGIELDVHTTKDGELVVHHDYYLGNPDNGTGRISDMEYPYVKKLTIKSKYHLPTLDEVLAKFGDSLHYELEVKAFTYYALEKVISVVRKHGLTKCVELTSPHHLMFSKLKQSGSKFTTGYFAMPQPEWMDDHLYRSICISQATIGGFDILHCESSIISPEFVQEARAADLRIHAADCDKEDDLRKVLRLGVDQLSTNQLALAIAARTKAFRR